MWTRQETLREYLRGALWVLPGLCALVALALGLGLSRVQVGPQAALHQLVFQGTVADARQLLTSIVAVVTTVTALVLGLTTVALQLATANFSPRLMGNFLRDRPNKVVLSIFVATFAYSAGGLYAVGSRPGASVGTYPQLAVTGAPVLLFGCLAALIYFAHHLQHSIQLDTIMSSVGEHVIATINREPPGVGRASGLIRAERPAWAVKIPARRSGYVQTIHPELILPTAVAHDVTVCVVPAIGEYIVAGSALAWVWKKSSGPPLPGALHKVVSGAVSIGIERTMQQDVRFGMRQLVDTGLRSMSSPVKDPYTAEQAINWLAAVLCTLADRALGDEAVRDHRGEDRIIVAAPSFEDYLELACGQIRRAAAAEPTVDCAMLHLLGEVGAAVTSDERQAIVAEQARRVLADAERSIARPEDLSMVRTQAGRMLPAAFTAIAVTPAPA